jgi:hypothetical protein
MAQIAILKKDTKELVNTIVAEMDDECPDDCYFVEIPKGFVFKDGEIVRPMKEASATPEVF